MFATVSRREKTILVVSKFFIIHSLTNYLRTIYCLIAWHNSRGGQIFWWITPTETVLLSAKRIYLSLLSLGKSFIKIKKSSSPRTDPCDTHRRTGLVSDCVTESLTTPPITYLSSIRSWILNSNLVLNLESSAVIRSWKVCAFLLVNFCTYAYRLFG